MDKPDVVLLLTLAGTYDYRKVGDADVEAWYLAVGDLDLEEAKAAVVRHYRESTDRLMPAHVRVGVKAIRDERRRAAPSEARALPSRFEPDMSRQVRISRGAATVRDVLAPLMTHLAEKSGHDHELSALDQLRELTAGPGWHTDGEAES